MQLCVVLPKSRLLRRIAMDLLTRRSLIHRSLCKYFLESKKPNRIYSAHNWKHVWFELSDSNTMSWDSIDIIIGVNLFGMLVINDVCFEDSENERNVENTTLGWMLFGLMASLPRCNWVNFRVCASRWCPSNSRSRSLSLLRERGSSSESAS